MNPEFRQAVEALAGLAMADCYQCGKCSAGCPMTAYMDLLPNQIMRKVMLGLADVLESKTPWLCASCETCTTRCPQELDIALIMDTLRQMALEQGKVPAGLKDITAFHETFLQSIRGGGRLFEAGLEGVYKMKRPNHLFDDLIAGLKMGIRGKLHPLPHLLKERARIKMIFDKSRAGKKGKA